MGLNGIPGAPLDVYDCYIGATVLYGNATFIVKKKKVKSFTPLKI